LPKIAAFYALGGDETFFIKDLETKRVLGLENSAAIDGTDVILDLEDNYESMSQKWVLVPYFDLEDAEGKEWFTMKNILSERFLTATDSQNLKIRGKNLTAVLKTKLILLLIDALYAALFL
jgi:hypothetical protein